MTRRVTLLCFTLLCFLILAACEPEVVEVTRLVTEEKVVVATRLVEVEGEEKVLEVTKIVLTEVEALVTATAEPAEEVEAEPEPADMFFRDYGVNPQIDTQQDHLSTFAMDVDTASYVVARRYVNDGIWPPAEAIRTEEFVNYFSHDYPPPSDGEFAVYTEGAPTPFGEDGAYLMRVGIQAQVVPQEERKDASLTFVVDVSGSMDMENRLELVKGALHLLMEELRPTDQVALVVYGSRGRVVLEHTPVSDYPTILGAISELQPEGSTNAEEGLRLGYDLAMRNYLPDGINRLILCSDGVANVGRTGPDAILATVRDYVDMGITLSTVGFGMGNYNDVLMEQLADDGNGNYAYVDTLAEARRVFEENLTAMLQTVALDAKIQVDFNPEVVESYRLLGYENRAMADEDFRDDTKDAGEVGSGQSVTALYELELRPVQGVIATVYVRYLHPETHEPLEQIRVFYTDEVWANFEDAPAGFQLDAAVAEYAEILKGSYWARGSSLQAVYAVAEQAAERLPYDADIAEFVSLVARASDLRR